MFMLSTQKNLVFQPLELNKKICEISEEKPLGYWQIKLYISNQEQRLWNLALFHNHAFFSGDNELSVNSFFEILYRYIPSLRNPKTKALINSYTKEIINEQNKTLRVLINKMILEGLLQYDQVIGALKLQMLTDFDSYLFDYQGEANFIEDHSLIALRPIPGFDLKQLVQEVNTRRIEWKKLSSSIPSMEALLSLDQDLIRRQNLPDGQKTQLKQMISTEKTLRELARELGKDPLSLAKVLATLVQRGLIKVNFNATSYTAPIPSPPLPQQLPLPSTEPKIFIVDDSPLMIQQFKRMVTSMGYKVEATEDPLTAVEAMLACQPKMIFLDVNMPNLSGFQLIKEIRKQPSLASVPLVILTAEKSSTNKFRAEWSKSKFLCKPTNPTEISHFHQELKSLLVKLC